MADDAEGCRVSAHVASGIVIRITDKQRRQPSVAATKSARINAFCLSAITASGCVPLAVYMVSEDTKNPAK